MAKHVAVLMGGFSAEREISLRSGRACISALKELGYEVSAIDVSHDIAQKLANLKCDMVLNLLHGRYGEDGIIQGMLEFLNIPYSHSGVLASALAMDKAMAKKLVAACGVTVAPSMIFNRRALFSKDFKAADLFATPYVIKPRCEGSSFGIFLVKQAADFPCQALTAPDWPYGDELIIEAYIAGRELTCGVMGDRALAVCEIKAPPSFAFYDYKAKYDKGASQHICPAQLSANIYQNVQDSALKAHKALGCRGVTRSDFRYDEAKGQLIWLEINTQPGMTETSLLPDLARHHGISFKQLVQYMVEDASCRR